MKKHTPYLLLVSLLLLLGASACSISLAQDVTPPPGYQAPVYEDAEVLTGVFPSAEPDPAAGQAIYVEKCLPCHGETGMGDGDNAAALPNPVAQIGNPEVASLATPQEWYTITMNGNLDRFMPPFSGSLNDQDVWNVLAYVFSLGTDEAVLAEGADLYAQTCTQCHGTGAGDAIPGATDHRDAEVMTLFSLDDIVQKVATGNGNTDHVFANVLDASQQQAVAYYVRSLVFPYGVEPAVAEATPAPTQAAEDSTTPTEEAPAGAEETPAPTEAATAEDVGQVTGVVVNGSGGELPSGLEVTLEVYENFDLSYTETTSVAADGTYAFEDITINADLIYLTMVEMNGTFFPSNFFMGEQPEDNVIDLPITVYDVTDDPADLTVSRLHVFFQFVDDTTVQVIHQVSISNLGNAVVLPADGGEALLNFTLPEGATNLIFQTGTMGNPYVQTDTGFADPSSVVPGDSTYELLYAYNLPYDRKLDWSLPMDLPTDIAVIFVQGADTKVDSDTLTASGSESLDTDVYQVFVANNLSAGDELDLRMSGGSSLVSGNVVSIVLGVVGLALAGYGAWRFFRPADDEEYEEEEFDSEAVIAEIVALDEAFEAGELDEADYTAQRDALKAELKQLLDEDEAA